MQQSKSYKKYLAKHNKIIAVHMDQIMQIPACSEGRTQQLRFIFDKIGVHVRGLTSLGIPADQYGSLLIPVSMSKLPSEIRLLVARKATDNVWIRKSMICSKL